jgi:arsenate reductase
MIVENQGTARQTVLFLCTGNSCRSQLAEAIVNAEMGAEWRAISAGTKPAGYVHPMAAKVLSEIGIEHHGFSKNTSQFINEPIDLVVTVCDSAAEDCPVWLGSNPQVHLAFEDPAAFEGDEQSKLEKFRQVRDEIAEKIPGLLARYEKPPH